MPASAVRSARRSSRRASRDNLRASAHRSQPPATAPPFRLNPLWPELPQRNYAIGPIEAEVSGSSASETSASASSPATPRRSAEELAAQVIDMQELELADLVHQRQVARNLAIEQVERQRQQDWERDQYYIRLSEEARRVTQMQQPRQHEPQQDVRQQQWSSGRSRSDRHRHATPPPLADQTAWSQTHTNTPSSSSQEPRDPQHKVYLLNCRHCGNFLSDRGMRAVLLLKPNITLYSTDAVPSNCGPYYSPSTFHGGVDPLEPPIERTCNCLTQSLGCHGCGNQVGYSILSPCDQCNSSVQKHQRSSNGHRTVLHCSEISVRERRYVPGEPGVRAAPYQCEAAVAPSTPHAALRRQTPRIRDYASERAGYPDFYDVDEDDDVDPEKTDFTAQAYQQHQLHDVDPRQLREPRSTRSNLRPTGSGKEARVLRRGDVIYWSDLVSGGERTQPFDPDPILQMPAAGR
ncbi:uncharacterized protein PSFLO_05307 [Pseudozyma flocculosa]|uniref:Uncharacterized protein n=2 Tax=Pseudozyma flocculosa TaxID=84751 RepID=A0A5C3F6Y2_9BASI|nr:uncharacterized protein PSFLO_05307 [Pseudozyma flocculosa]